ncbi:MAG: Na(+)/H(+) antiporter subunit D [Verrucomicrobiales bacterium]
MGEFVVHPGLILIVGAFLVPFLKGNLKSVYVIALPVVAFIAVAMLPMGEFFQIEFLKGFGDVTLLRADKLSKAFGFIFTINATATFLYAFYLKDSQQHVSALIYIGSALGSVFAGDLITLYVFWEIMAVASTMLILARRSSQSYGAGLRYVLVHVFGGLLFLAGIVITVNTSGSIAFDHFNPADQMHAGTWLILIGFLVNAAAPPFSAWLSDAYPESTVTGGLILSAYTTKTAVYTMIRGFPGWEILIWVGCIMTVYGIIYALLENDMRRILAYSIINQVGFMVCAVGIGTELALNGAVAHAFCHIIYKSLLWMSAGAVLYRVGKSKCTDLGGLYKTMPWSLGLGVIGALAISAVPLTSGFTSKTMIISEAHHSPSLFWAWLTLEVASAGVFLHAGIKFPYFVFFAKDKGMRPKEAPRTMIAAMCILAFLCIFLGIYPQPLYNILPFPVDFHPFKFEKVVTQMQLLMFSALTFFLFLPLLKRTDTIVIDSDFFYRKAGKWFLQFFDWSLNGINAFAYRLFVKGITTALNGFFNDAPARIAVFVMVPVWASTGMNQNLLQEKRDALYNKIRLGTFPIGITALLAVLLLALLFLFSFRGTA